MSATLFAIDRSKAEARTGNETGSDDGLEIGVRPIARMEASAGPDHPGRHLSIYDPKDAFGLIGELAHLAERSIERNIFYDPRFLVPAMSRLEDRNVCLLVMRDESENRSRLRLFLPYSIERTGLFGRQSSMRVWSHPFGPLGSLPLDGDDPVGTLKSLVSTLSQGPFDLPDVLVIPDVRLEGGMASAVKAAAGELGLAIQSVNHFSRAALLANPSSPLSLLDGLPGKRRRNLQRGRRWLEGFGSVSVEQAREPDHFRKALEDFLILEASGWKGRARSALISDRYRAAFAREALNNLAGSGQARIFTLRLDNEAIASIILLIDGGDAYAWKSAYCERYAKASPGQQIMAEATRTLIADPTIRRADSCAMPDHLVMNRFWRDRIELGTLVLAMKPGKQQDVATIARSIEKSKRSANRHRLMREAIGSIFGR